MSRTIKYRVWDNENKSYNDPYSSAYYAMAQDGGLDFYCHGDHMREADPDVYFIEQYTGLTDKNGKEIYEGDIVSCYSLSGEYGALFVVKYGKLPDICGHEYCPCLQGFYLDEIDEYEEVDEEGYIEVIGNVHEYPELLGEEK